ncbi:hypothetical protein Tco_0559414, partial [Tanacetum coccineum]
MLQNGNTTRGPTSKTDDIRKPFKEVPGLIDLDDQMSRFARAANLEEWLMTKVHDNIYAIENKLQGQAKITCSELAKMFSDRDPRTVDEIMRRVDDFVRLEKAYTADRHMQIPAERSKEVDIQVDRWMQIQADRSKQ